mgnify:CR=1 FL=1
MDTKAVSDDQAYVLSKRDRPGDRARARLPRDDPRERRARDPGRSIRGVMTMRILFVGDVVGAPGRRIVRDRLEGPQARRRRRPHDRERRERRGRRGLTAATAEELFAAGADVITTGNHVWDKREALGLLERERRILRPANYPEGSPGSGCRRRHGRGNTRRRRQPHGARVHAARGRPVPRAPTASWTSFAERRRVVDRRLPRRGDEREDGVRLASRRPGRRRPRDPHACGDRGRARPARAAPPSSRTSG